MARRTQEDSEFGRDCPREEMHRPHAMKSPHEGPTAPADGPRPEASPIRLGSLLYADPTGPRVTEEEWVSLVRSIAARDALALRALYERTHRLVFTLVLRITRSKDAAEELTVDVFHDVWRRSAEYDASAGSVLGWIMNQAHSRAIDRMRFERRQKRTPPPADPAHGSTEKVAPEIPADEGVALQQQSRSLRAALSILTPDERSAIETAYFAELTYAEVADRLQQPLGTIKTRIRSGLGKLREALASDRAEP